MTAPALAVALSAAAALSCVAACDGVRVDEPGARVDLRVAPLDLPGVTDAEWRLTVTNQAGEVVWTRDVASSAYGDGTGSASYVGTCDADANDNRADVRLLALYGPGGAPLAADAYADPGVLTRTFTCLADRDVALDFDVTVARRAVQGFFDVAIAFDDVYCSAKLDCVDAAGDPLLLLHDADGVRARTAVLAFACTADTGADVTHLYLDALDVTCADRSATVDPSAGPGNLADGAGVTQDAGTPALFAAQVSRGHEQLGAHKVYWNVLLGLAPDAPDCAVETRGTAYPGELLYGETPADTTWPYVHWQVPLTGAGGALACTRHPLDGTPAGVATEYTALAAPIAFAATFDGFTAAPTAPNTPPQIDAVTLPAGGYVAPSASAGLAVTASDADLDPLSYSWAFVGDATGWSLTQADTATPTVTAAGAGGAATVTLRVTVDDGRDPVTSDVGLTNVARASCADYLAADPDAPTDVYLINPTGSDAFQVYCDMDTAGGGWTLLSNRRAGSNNTEACGSNIATFFLNGCGTVTSIGASNSYALNSARRAVIPRTQMLVTQFLSGALDTDDVYMIDLGASFDPFPNDVNSLNIAVTGVCNIDRSVCDTSNVFWKYIGDYWFHSAMCFSGSSGSATYRGNYGVCHDDAYNAGSAATYPVSSFTGDRSAYEESKLWGINTGSLNYQERIWFR
ncbi:MAG: hypothetical protein EP329_27320 [Deltaproteobacteria bacterium]|nr:MAG: hypothetical protein EP329_27320 [Deltaproteobacteria bacterium]